MARSNDQKDGWLSGRGKSKGQEIRSRGLVNPHALTEGRPRGVKIPSSTANSANNNNNNRH
jgi:hypothetical protein